MVGLPYQPGGDPGLPGSRCAGVEDGGALGHGLVSSVYRAVLQQPRAGLLGGEQATTARGTRADASYLIGDDQPDLYEKLTADGGPAESIIPDFIVPSSKRFCVSGFAGAAKPQNVHLTVGHFYGIQRVHRIVTRFAYFFGLLRGMKRGYTSSGPAVNEPICHHGLRKSSFCLAKRRGIMLDEGDFTTEPWQSPSVAIVPRRPPPLTCLSPARQLPQINDARR
jgi:hypothetical protein